MEEVKSEDTGESEEGGRLSPTSTAGSQTKLHRCQSDPSGCLRPQPKYPVQPGWSGALP